MDVRAYWAISEKAKFEVNWRIDNPRADVTVSELLDPTRIRLFNNPAWKPAGQGLAPVQRRPSNAKGGDVKASGSPTSGPPLSARGETKDRPRLSISQNAGATGGSAQGTGTGAAAPSSPRGSSRARVYLGKYRGKEVAVRRCYLDKRVMQNAHETAFKQVNELMQGLAHFRHPNTVLFMGAYIDSDHVGIVKEYMARGALDEVVHDPQIVLEWDTVMSMLIDVCHGMSYLHGHTTSAARLHEDLRTSRLLVDHNWRVKVSAGTRSHAHTHVICIGSC
jgi:serine/threonine protein kinase